MLSLDTVDTWSPRLMAHEYRRRLELIDLMVGTLYPGIVAAEMRRIAEACVAKYGRHPNHFLDR